MKALLFAPDADPEVVVVKKTEERGMLDSLQAFVAGSIQFLPHKDSYEAPYVAYVNENGMALDLKPNFGAWGTLVKLGFTSYSILPGAYLGNVIVLGANEKELSDTQIKELKSTYQQWATESGLVDDQ